MYIGLVPNPEKDLNLEKTKSLAVQIKDLGGNAVIDEKYKEYFDDFKGKIRISGYDNCDMLICLGGDGTFLTAVHDYLHKDIPIIGINFGSVGFLAEISPENTGEALKKIFAKDYKIEKRILLEGECYSQSGKKKTDTLCLNDIVISRGGISKIMALDLFIDDVPVERLPGDGVIVSTPTGSTAYSLSAGGPIIDPKLETILITPLNPHSLHNRSYVVSPESTVKVVIGDYSYNPALTSDGEMICILEKSDTVYITKSDVHMNLVKLEDKNFYESLGGKIYTRGLKR